MPDEVSMSEDAEATEAIPSIVHDDIMQRLLNYQRQLREGLTPEEAAESVSAPAPAHRAAPPWPAPTARPTETAAFVNLAAVEEPVEIIEVVAVGEAADAEPSETVTEMEAAAPAGAVPQIPTALSIAEPTMMPARSASPADAWGDLTTRLAELEDTLTSVAKSIGDLRAQLQSMAITADDRLSATESALSGAQDAAANGLLIRASNTISRLLYSDRSGR